MNLAWNAPSSDGGSAITGYRVYRGTTSGGETLLTTLGTATSYLDTSVLNGTTYYYQVSAINAVGEGPRSTERSATPLAPATAPGAPTLNSATAGNGSVSLAWSAPASNGGSAITGYKLYRGTSSGGETLLRARSATSRAGPTRRVQRHHLLLPGERRQRRRRGLALERALRHPGRARDRARRADAQRADRRQRHRRARLERPAPTAAPRSPATRSTAAPPAAARPCSPRSAPSPSWTDTNAANGTTYYYQVSAVNSVGEGARSNERSATPTAPATVPGAPTLNSATRRQRQRHARLERPVRRRLRDHRLQGLPRHRERRRDPADHARQRHQLDRHGAANGTTYYYQVAPSTPSARAHAPTSAPPPRPRGDRARRADAQLGDRRQRQRHARLERARPNGGSAITGYRVYRGTSSGGETLLTTLGNVTELDGHRRRERDHLLLPGQRRQRASARAPLQRALRHPARRRPARRADAQLGHAPATAASRSPGLRPPRTAAPRSPATRSTAAPRAAARRCSRPSATSPAGPTRSAANGTTYYYQVSAVNAVGEGARSNERSATPAAPATVPGAPTLNSATAGNGSVALAWSAPASNGGSAITRLQGLPRHRRAATRRLLANARQRHQLDRHDRRPTARPTTTRSRRQRGRRGPTLQRALRHPGRARDRARRADPQLGDRRQRQRRARLERPGSDGGSRDHRLQGLPRHLERRRDPLRNARHRHRAGPTRAPPTARPTTTRSAP